LQVCCVVIAMQYSLDILRGKANFVARKTSMIRVFRVAVCVSLVALFPAAALAQFESASLTGTVTDAAGAVVPAAAVKAVNEATNLETAGLTNEEGRFFFSNLRPGSYRVVASAKGFKQFVSQGVVLQVNQAGRLDIALTVGEVTEQVLVNGEAPVLETESA